MTAGDSYGLENLFEESDVPVNRGFDQSFQSYGLYDEDYLHSGSGHGVGSDEPYDHSDPCEEEFKRQRNREKHLGMMWQDLMRGSERTYHKFKGLLAH